MFELIGVIITNIAKWFKSADNNKHRRLGFGISAIASVLWIVYFIMSNQYYLAGNSVVTICIIIRGIVNNPKENYNV